jgi:GxxExxY protein
VDNVTQLEQAASAVERLALQMEELTLAEQVCLLRRLAQCIEQKIGVPPIPNVQAASVVNLEQSAPATPRERSPIPAALETLTYRIIGCAQAVHRQLGRGLREDSYQRALEVRFAQAGLAYRPQQQFAVYDSVQADGVLGKLLGYYIPDFVVEDKVIVEIKAIAATDTSHVSQVVGYLVVSGCPVGLLINFGERSLHPRRILPPSDVHSHQINVRWLWNPSQNPGNADTDTDADTD